MKKGQALTLEQMFFFTIGIVILISVFFSFSSIKEKITEISTEDQMNEVGELVLSGISKVANELEYNNQYELIVNMPESVADNNYIVEIVNNQLRIEVFDKSSILLDLESIDETYAIGGSALGSIGSIKINGNSASKTILISRYERI